MSEGDAPQESGHADRSISRPGPGKQGRRDRYRKGQAPQRREEGKGQALLTFCFEGCLWVGLRGTILCLRVVEFCRFSANSSLVRCHANSGSEAGVGKKGREEGEGRRDRQCSARVQRVFSACSACFQAMARQMATAAIAPAASAAKPARTACRVRRMPMEPK